MKNPDDTPHLISDSAQNLDKETAQRSVHQTNFLWVLIQPFVRSTIHHWLATKNASYHRISLPLCILIGMSAGVRGLLSVSPRPRNRSDSVAGPSGSRVA